MTSGTNNYTEMKRILDNINQTNNKNLNLSDIYEYSELTHSFVLNQVGVAEQLAAFQEDIQKAPKQDQALLKQSREAFVHSLGEQIDIKSVLQATGSLERDMAKSALQNAVNNYNLGASKQKQISQELVDQAVNGSFDAITQIYGIIGRSMSFDEQTSFLGQKAEKLLKATDVFTASVGDNIDEYSAKLLQQAGGAAEQQGDSDVWKITKSIAPNKLAQAYLQAYTQGLEDNLTSPELEEILKKSWDASSESQKQISDVLKNASSMTMNEFGEFLKSQGQTLTQQLLQDLQSEGIFSQLKDGSFRLDLEKFANKFNIDKSSREYIDAYSSLQDTIIKQQTQQRENLESQIKSILQAKPGDKLNVSQLMSVFSQDLLEQMGLEFKDGIATISKETNLTQVASRIAQACADAGAIIPQQLQAIQDAIEEVLQSFIDALSKGIKGNLSSSDKRNVISQAQQLLGQELNENSFIKTADGFKLTTDAAIQMYSALQKIDKIQASKLFEDLADRTFGSNSGMQTMTGQMAKMAELQRQINDLRAKSSTAGEEQAQGAISNTIAKLQQQLALYQQVAQARAMGNPQSYDFMGQSLPNYLKGPENYWNAWGNAFQAMHNAAKNGGYSIQEFYNIVNEMNNIAGLTGKEFQIFGQTLDGGIQGMTRLIEKGFRSIKNIDGKGAKVTLEGIGIDFESGAAGMGANIEDGIHAMAQSQISMLDGLIAFLQTIVAMQKLGDVDTDFSGSIEIGEIFEGGNVLAGTYTKGFAEWQKNFKQAAEKNKELKQSLQNVTTQFNQTTMSVYELATLTPQQQAQNAINYAMKQGAKEGTPEFNAAVQQYGKSYTEFMNKFYQAVTSKQWNEKNPFSAENYELLAKSGLNLEYTIPGTQQKVVVQDGKYIISNEKGQFVVDGKSYKDAGQALKAQNKLQGKQILEQFKQAHRGSETLKILESDQNHIKIQTNGTKYDIQTNQDGKFTINGEGSYETWAKVQQKMVDDLNTRIEKEGGTKLSTQAAKIRLGITAQPEVITSVSQLSTEQIQQLKAAGLDTKKKIQQAFANDPEECQVKFKFKLAQDSKLESNFNENLESRMEQADVTLTANITAEGESVQINGDVHVNLIADSVQVPNQVPVKLVGAGIETSNMHATNEATPVATPMAESAVTNPLAIIGETFSNKIGQVYEQASRYLSETITKTGEKTKESVENVTQEVTVPLERTQQAMTQVKETMVKESKKQKPELEEHHMASKGSKRSSEGDNEGAAQVEANAQALSAAVGEAGNAFAEGAAMVGESGSTASSAMSELSGAISQGAGAAQSTASSMAASWASMPSGTKTVNLQVNVAVSASAAKGSIKSINWSPHSQTFVKGNIALASGQKTLMGELGPELVVSNGQYYVVGQTGAQMVDLAPDAIVFNHLQTKKLLSNGHTGRGQPITNERTAVAWAKGTGPAMASAQAVLSALKQIRAMWQAMLGASMKDLGALAGNEGGGGGGGGGKKKPQQLKAILDDIERWYNLVRQIDRLEQDITYQESLQAKIQSDRVANGKALYRSQKQQIKLLDEQIIRNQQLAELQRSFYERRRQEFADSDYGIFYTYDDQGQLQLRDGINKGMDALFKLNEKGVYGETTGAATNAKTQIEYLRSIGFNTENLMYNGDGTKIDPSDESYKDNPDKIYEDMMDNFWENLDGWKDELDGIYDQYREQLNTVIENQDRRNQILQAIVDNQLSVQQDVLKAIESREQKLIDELQDQRDALEDSTQRFIDGLTDQLKEERQMYENEETQRELVKLRRQVAILQRSGGSASQIRSLQDQIAAKQQDQYFDQQEQQIAAIQKASDLQIERLDSQIDLMTKALEYQKENGLLWQEVYQVMLSTPQQIRQFIMQNTPDFQSASALDVAQKIRDIDLRINEWVAARDDENNPLNSDNFYDWKSYSASREKMWGDASDQLKAQAQAKFAEVFKETADINLAGAAADEIFRAVLGDRPPKNPNGENQGNGTNNKNNNYTNYQPYSGNYNTWHKVYTNSTPKNSATKEIKNLSSGPKPQSEENIPISISNSPKMEIAEKIPLSYDAKIEIKTKPVVKTISGVTFAQPNYTPRYASGGLVNYTGIAQVDGTPSRPEAFLNAEQTQLLRNRLFGSSDSLLALANDIVQQLHGASYSSNTLHQEENNGINIQNVDVNVNVKQIANDYDVRAIGNTVMDEMLKIARKSGTRGLSRR